MPTPTNKTPHFHNSNPQTTSLFPDHQRASQTRGCIARVSNSRMRVRLAHRVLTNPMRARGVRKGISRSYQDDDDDDNDDATAPAAPAPAPPAPPAPATATAALLLQLLLLLQPLLKHRSESQISFVLHRVQCARAAAGLHGRVQGAPPQPRPILHVCESAWQHGCQTKAMDSRPEADSSPCTAKVLNRILKRALIGHPSSLSQRP